MAKSRNQLDNALRERFLSQISELLENSGEEVYQFKSNAIFVPCLDEEGNECSIQVEIKVPKGSRDGEPFDGYTASVMYKEKVENDRKKKEEAEAKKQAKIEKDRLAREKLKASKEAHAK